MGKTYALVKELEQTIERMNLPLFPTKGRVSMRAGFIVTAVKPDTPDDPVKLAALKEAIKAVLAEVS